MKQSFLIPNSLPRGGAAWAEGEGGRRKEEGWKRGEGGKRGMGKGEGEGEREGEDV
jgi:hypothetical protein